MADDEDETWEECDNDEDFTESNITESDDSSETINEDEEEKMDEGKTK